MRNTAVFSKNDRVDKSPQHSMKDGVAFLLMTGSSESDFAALAIFLKATAPQLALLASLPPLERSFSYWLWARNRGSASTLWRQ
jgi:xanthine/CO dehydrogenase XdhC/CoxF family maturation factor